MIAHVKIRGEEERLVIKNVTVIKQYPRYVYFQAIPDSELTDLYERWTKNGIPRELVEHIECEMVK